MIQKFVDYFNSLLIVGELKRNTLMNAKVSSSMDIDKIVTASKVKVVKKAKRNRRSSITYPLPSVGQLILLNHKKQNRLSRQRKNEYNEKSGNIKHPYVKSQLYIQSCIQHSPSLDTSSVFSNA